MRGERARVTLPLPPSPIFCSVNADKSCCFTVCGGSTPPHDRPIEVVGERGGGRGGGRGKGREGRGERGGRKGKGEEGREERGGGEGRREREGRRKGREERRMRGLRREENHIHIRRHVSSLGCRPRQALGMRPVISVRTLLFKCLWPYVEHDHEERSIEQDGCLQTPLWLLAGEI